MGAAIIGLIGAVLGATTALIGSIASDRRQGRDDETRWRRDRRGAAYDGALRHLLRTTNWRSGLSYGDGMTRTYIQAGNIGDFFSDLVEAQFWLRTLAGACGIEQVDRIRQVADEFDEAIGSMDSEGPKSIIPTARRAVEVITDCARADIGSHAVDAQTTSQAHQSQ